MSQMYFFVPGESLLAKRIDLQGCNALLGFELGFGGVGGTAL